MNMDHNTKITLASAGIVVLIISFSIGTLWGERRGREEALLSIAPSGISITNEQFAPFWKVWNVLDEKYVEATTTDTQDRIWGAVQGLASSQGDPYTVFFPPEETKTFKSDIKGEFEGVGMEIGIKDGVLTVVSPIKGSPAEKAGVKAGDIIIKIDEKTTADISVDQAVKLIRGARGTTVKIVFLREGSNEPLEKSIIRDVIDIPTLETEIEGDVFIIKLYSFSAKSPGLFRDALRSFLLSGKNKLIVDLRGNPGGYLEAAWDITSWFLPLGEVIITEDFGGKEENKIYRSKGYDVLKKYYGDKYKMVVLVNGGSASASEIMAGALQEHGIAKLVGTKTFGKGSVQELVSITPETSLKVTIARWMTPNGHNLSSDGLEPDFEVKASTEDDDPQLEKALEILKD